MSLLTVWKVIEVILFSLLGASLVLNPCDCLLQGVILTIVGVSMKVLVSVFTTNTSELTCPERIYCAVCRIPKATIQAAFSGVLLTAGLFSANDLYMDYGRQMMNVAGVAVLLTAGFACLIPIVGAKALSCDQQLTHTMTTFKPLHIPTPLMRMRQTLSQHKQF